MSFLDKIKSAFGAGKETVTTASEAVAQKICGHESAAFLYKQPVGNQAIKFEWHYQCNECGAELVTEEPR